ncbi:MAG: histidine kinase [Deltaproteobacteria bacterium]|nr:histidine kinase [Deltaproteobacteria bacterium]
MPLVFLAYNTRELELFFPMNRLPHVDRAFVWQGDNELFFAMVKVMEDQLNVEHDVKTAGVQVLLLVEDSARFYSSYLPMLYKEVMKQTQALMFEGANRFQKLMRMRARPKILLATTWEEAAELYRRFDPYILGVIVDASFPRGGKEEDGIGFEFARMVRSGNADRPVLIQSTELKNGAIAHQIGARFIHKQSPSLLAELGQFMQDHLGFGDFVFRRPDGQVVARARDMGELTEALQTVPDESLLYHANRNHFSAWLLARTEFDLARRLRPRRVWEFENATAMRRYLLRSVLEQQERSAAGVVAEFSTRSLKPASMFVRIGPGSLGGKGRGLAFMNALMDAYKIKSHVPSVRISVPPTAILATGVFDEFMEHPGLLDLVLSGNSTDGEIKDAFLAAPLPAAVRADLRAFLSRVRYPLAVRSSSLLEDASLQPFAGVYRTYMLPNNNSELDVRLEELCIAIRLVYASTYYRDARTYVDSTPSRLEEEKMAVVIQQLVGNRHGNYHYPDVSGIARSRNVYPAPGMTAEDGVALAALGLGGIVMEGGRCVRFSPAHPHTLLGVSSVRELLQSSQREFYALNLSAGGPTGRTTDETYDNLSRLGLENAEEHGTLHAVGSVYSPDNDAVYDGISREGPRLITLAGILKSDLFPLAETLSFLLEVGEAGFSTPIEMEFAVRLSDAPDRPHQFGFLQVRSQGGCVASNGLSVEKIDADNTVCVSRRALGHGAIPDVCDIVYVRRDRFDRSRTVDIAREIGQATQRLRSEERPFVLIGQGRWGSSDRWLGIPVTWSQIAGVRCIVETDMDDMAVEPSQGSHFFQNITSLGIGYFTVNFGSGGGLLDYAWLDAQPPILETPFVRVLRFPEPIDIAIDNLKGLGVIMKPGFLIDRTCNG